MTARTRWLGWGASLLTCAASSLVAPAAWAQAPQAPSCNGPWGSEHDALLARTRSVAERAQLPMACLKAHFAVCATRASEGLLDPGSAEHCSLSYEALLRSRFKGDFNALMAWWRSERDAMGAGPPPR